MFNLIAVLWCLSPLLLIPLSISYSSERKKLRRFLDQLYKDNRISHREWINLYAESRRRQAPMEDDYRPAPGMPYLPKDIDKYRREHGGNYPPVRQGLNYPGMQNSAPTAAGSVFRDENRRTSNAPAAPAFRGPVGTPPMAPNAAQPVVNTVQTAFNDEKIFGSSQPRKKLLTPEEQNRIMQEKLAKAEGRSIEEMPKPAPKAEKTAAAAEEQPHHHHDGVDLVKHAEKPVQASKAAAKPAVQPGVQPDVQTNVQPNVQPNMQPNVQPNVQPNMQPNMQPQRRQPAAAQTMQPMQGQPAFYQNGAPAYGQPLPQWAQQQPPRPPKPKRPKKQYSPTAIFTGIGITFVVLAGIIFSRAFWVSWSNWTRVGVLAGQAALFFGMYGFASKKLKIEGTSAAMYILGSVYTTISYITTGYFGMFGAWFGIEGRGMMLFLALGALIVTLFSARAMKIFKKPFCEYAASISMAVSGTLLLAQFANYFTRNYAAFALLITAAGTAVTAIYLWRRSHGHKPSGALRTTHIVIRAVYLLIAAPMLFMDINNGSGEGFGWSVFGWGICLIYMGECLWHAIRLRSEKWLACHAIFILAGAFSLFLDLNDYRFFSLCITLFAIVGGWAYVWLKKTDRLLFEANSVYMTIRILFAMAALPALFIHDYTNIQFVLAGLWAVDFAALAAVRKKQIVLLPNCVALLNMFYELMVLMSRRYENEAYGAAAACLIILGIGIVGTGLYTFLERKGKAYVRADGINIMMRVFMGLPMLYLLLGPMMNLERWNGLCWALCLISAAELTAYTVIRRSQIPLAFQFVFVLAGIYMLMPVEAAYGASRGMWTSITVWGVCAVGTALYLILGHFGKNIVRAKEVIIGWRFVTTTAAAFMLLTCYPDWHWTAWLLCGGIAAEMLIIAICKRDERILGVHALFLTGILAECYFVMDDIPAFSLWVTMFMTAATMIYRALARRDKLRFKANVVAVCMRTIFGVIALSYAVASFKEWNYESFAIFAVIALETLCYGISRKNEGWLFVHAASLTLMLAKIGEYTGRYEHFMLMICGVAAVGSLVYYLLHRAGKLRFDAKHVVGVVRAVYTVLCIPMFIIHFTDFEPVTMTVLGLLCVESLCYAIVFKEQKLLGLHALFLADVLGECAFKIDDIGSFSLWVTALLMALSMIYAELGRRNKLRFDAKYVVIGMRGLFGAAALVYIGYHYDRWDYSCFGIFAVVALETLYYGISRKKESWLYVHAVFATFMLREVSMYIDGDSYKYFILMICGLAAAGTLAYYLLYRADKLTFRTRSLMTVVRSVYCALCIPVIVSHVFEFDLTVLAVLGILCIEGLCYGIALKNSKLIAVHSVFLTGTLWQLAMCTYEEKLFALFCCVTAAAGTLAYYLLGRKEKLRFRCDLVLAGIRSFYGVACLSVMLFEWQRFTWISPVIWSIITAELTYYSLRIKNRWAIRGQNVSFMVLSGVAASMIGRLLPGVNTGMFIFAMLIAVGMLLFRYFRGLYSKTGDCMMMSMLFGLGIALMTETALPYGVITMLMAAVFLTVDAFDEKHFLSRGMRIVLPVPELITAAMLAVYLENTYGMHCKAISMAICAGVLCAAAFILSFGINEDRKYAVMKYSTELGACAALLFGMTDRRPDVAAGVAIMIVSAALFAVIQLSKKNFHSALPAITLFAGASRAAGALWYDPMREGTAVIIFSIFMTAMFAAASRLMFPEKLYRKNENGKFHIDTAQAAIVLCMLCCTKESMMFTPRARLFICLLELTVFIADLMRRKHSEMFNRISMTTATASAAAALMVRPFMVFENSMLTIKIILAIVVLFGLAVKKIWADNEKLSREFSQTVFMAAYLLLIVDGLMNQSLINSLIVLSVSLVLLVYSFIRKSRRWFLVSAAALLGLTLYITGDFLAAVAWWVYLLLSGIILIIVAAMTEYFRQKAAKNEHEDRFFVDWKW